MKTRRFKKITKNRLQECLNLIGWSIREMGNKFCVIVNQDGEIANISFWNHNGDNGLISEISIGDTRAGNIFGDKGSGSCVFVANRCRLEVRGDGNTYECVGIYPTAGDNPNILLQLYNFKNNND